MAGKESDTPGVPKVTLTTFAEYLTAPSSARIDCVRQQIRLYGQDYHPGPSFYRDFVDAVVEGRRTGADELVLKRVVKAQRDDTRREHYVTLARHWLALAELRLPMASCGRAVWMTSRLSVSIRPDFAIVDADGRVFVVKLWLKEHALAADAARAGLRLLDRHMAQLSAGATPLIVDVRREKIHKQPRRAIKRGFDDWLESEAEAMGGLWQRLAAA